MNAYVTAVGHRCLILAAVLLGSSAACAAEAGRAPSRLRIGVVQLALANTIASNRERIVARIAEAAARGARVVVFPEGAVRGAGDDDQALVEASIAAIRQAAHEQNVYVVFGGKTWSAQVNKVANWMYAVGPDGHDLMRYEKLYDNHRAAMPGVFLIDGIPCNAMICADRWLRGIEEVPIQQGARISFELSNNFACEWVGPLAWYWNVTRALRNNVWVVLANSCNSPSVESAPVQDCHGHSAIISPEGRLRAAAQDNAETILIADVDVSQATRAAAIARGAHPALRPFWEAGKQLLSGATVEAPPVKPLTSAEAEVTIAAAQVVGDLPAMLAAVVQARAKGADLVAFPARAIRETALEPLQAAAREQRITLVVGMEHRAETGTRNSAFVIAPDGSLLTRYDQLSAERPFQAGRDPKAMWFYVKGIPAIVTVERDAHWTELAELAAVVGARMHVHLDHDTATGPDARLQRLQVGANLVSFHTFSATVNVIESAIWDDLRDAEERRAVVRDLPRPQTGEVEIFSPFSANLIVRAGTSPDLILATRHVTPTNRHYPNRTSQMNPQMDLWYRLGADIVRPR